MPCTVLIATVALLPASANQDSTVIIACKICVLLLVASMTDAVRYGCSPSGGCNYLKSSEEYPYAGFCTFKQLDTPTTTAQPTNSASTTSQPTSSKPTHAQPTSSPISAKHNNQSPTSQCDRICIGSYPYGCATNLGGVVKYGCHPAERCNYLQPGGAYPYSGLCTYKEVITPTDQPSSSKPTTVKPMTTKPTSHPSSASPTTQPPTALCDGVCIGSYPYGCATNLSGVVRYDCHPAGGCNYLQTGGQYPYAGFCTYYKELITPTNQPTSSQPSTSKPNPTTPQPTNILMNQPNIPINSYLRCPRCTTTIWNKLAINGNEAYTCGDRITHLQTATGGSYSELDVCKHVVGTEFPNACGPECDPDRCNDILNEPDPSMLLCSDEFDVDGSPDSNKWDVDVGDGCNIGLCNWGNGEKTYYTNSLNNVYVSWFTQDCGKEGVWVWFTLHECTESHKGKTLLQVWANSV